MFNLNRPIELTERLPILKPILKSRLFQPALMMITLAGFTLAILTGLLGTPAGNRNFGIVFVWIVWWGLLILVLIPFTGRAWCAACPIPAPGEWLQRRGIINRTRGRLSSMRWRWPRRFRNMWLQNFGFLSMAIFSTIILTRPAVTAWVLLGFILIGIVLSILYENRVFCRYVCPVGGFIGLYSMVSPMALRVRDPQVCVDHKTKDCVTGNANGYGCPWMLYPGKLERNAYCGMCMECIKTCPHDNIVINLSAPGGDLLVAKERKLDEAYKAFIMLACALMYSAVLLGPWGWLKGWANMNTLPHWLLYAAGFLLVNLVGLPGLFYLTTAVARRLAGQQAPTKRLFIDYAYTLIPLGLAAWVAFSFGFVLINGSYALATASDPFGWGWNLFGTADAPWTPLGSGWVPFLQTGVLTIGLLFSTNIGYKIARQHSQTHQQAMRALLPLAGFMLLIVLIFLRLYLG
ncbi:MAG: 4Fe-4S binding protein [Anaerolineae bacterium]|nr:4Fe-4S binding protein [Anaerolineae bacterium]